MLFFRQILHEDSGCLSYLIGCPTTSVAAVVDPLEDTETYLGIAEREGFTITHLFETHIHADHLSGAGKLAQETGVKICLHEAALAKFEHLPLKDGDELDIGQVKLKVLHTPGHTPESICLLVDNRLLLTGDTLFVGSIGRPDFVGGDPEQLYESLYNKLMRLPDYVSIFPAHFGKSPCGGGLGGLTVSTIGYERRFNYALNIPTKAIFVKFVTTHLPIPSPPPDHEAIIRKNRGEE